MCSTVGKRAGLQVRHGQACATHDRVITSIISEVHDLDVSLICWIWAFVEAWRLGMLRCCTVTRGKVQVHSVHVDTV